MFCIPLSISSSPYPGPHPSLHCIGPSPQHFVPQDVFQVPCIISAHGHSYPSSNFQQPLPVKFCQPAGSLFCPTRPCRPCWTHPQPQATPDRLPPFPVGEGVRHPLTNAGPSVFTSMENPLPYSQTLAHFLHKN